MELAPSREPPLVEWSLPPPSISTPCAIHFAAQSTFQNNFPVPPQGAMRPVCPQHFVSSGFLSQTYPTVSPSKSCALVVIIFPHFSHMTEIGSHEESFSEPEISFKILRISFVRSSALFINGSIFPDR